MIKSKSKKKVKKICVKGKETREREEEERLDKEVEENMRGWLKQKDKGKDLENCEDFYINKDKGEYMKVKKCRTEMKMKR